MLVTVGCSVTRALVTLVWSVACAGNSCVFVNAATTTCSVASINRAALIPLGRANPDINLSLVGTTDPYCPPPPFLLSYPTPAALRGRQALRQAATTTTNGGLTIAKELIKITDDMYLRRWSVVQQTLFQFSLILVKFMFLKGRVRSCFVANTYNQYPCRLKYFVRCLYSLHERFSGHQPL